MLPHSLGLRGFPLSDAGCSIAGTGKLDAF